MITHGLFNYQIVMKQLSILLSFLLVFVFTGCKDFKEAEVTGIQGFNLTKLGTEGIEGELLLKIKNPNSMGFSVYPSEFDVVYSGIHLGKAKLDKRVHISANSEKVYTFKLKSSLGELNFLDIAKLLNEKDRGVVELTGDLKAGKFYLKKRYPVNLKQRVDGLMN
jgi:LEA14-like dessication related protein